MVIQDGWKLQFNWDGTLILTNPGDDPHELIDYDEAIEPKVQALWTLLEPKVWDAVAIYGREPNWPTF
jgi:hypothetical protein